MSLIEIAKTGRSKCRGCSKLIEKDLLRFGDQNLSEYNDAEDAQVTWYHLTCALEKRPAKLGIAIEAYKGDVPIPNRAGLIAALPDAERTVRLRKLVRAELSPSSQATCIQCGKRIEKSAMRLAVQLYEDPMMGGNSSLHLACAPSWVGSPQDPLAGQSDLTTQLKEFFRAIPNAKCPECTAIMSYVDPVTENVASGQLACAKCGGMFELGAVTSRKKPPARKKKTKKAKSAKSRKKN